MAKRKIEHMLDPLCPWEENERDVVRRRYRLHIAVAGVTAMACTAVYCLFGG